MTTPTKACKNCIYFDSTGYGRGKCDFNPSERISCKRCCDRFISMDVIAEDIDTLAKEEPFLKFYPVADKISEKHEGKIPLKLIQHLMRCSGLHKPVYDAWNRYKENIKIVERKIREEKKQEVLRRRIELGAVRDPDGPPPLQEAEELIDSGEVNELCAAIGIDSAIIEDQKENILDEYKRLSENRYNRRWRE
jgi:hypothetical protein